MEGGVAPGAYPAREVRLVAPFPEGHVTDLHARLLAPHMAEALSQQVIVDNWAGESGTVPLERLKNTEPDGYTLMMHGYGGLALAPHLMRVNYDPTRDFTAIALLVTAPLVLVANASLPVQSVADLVALATEDPTSVRGGSFGNASNSRLALALFNRGAGLEISHTAFAGGFDTTSDLVSRAFDVMFEFPPVVMPHITAGRLKPLAVTSKRRSAALPSVPTLEEAGVEGVEMVGWQGIIGPAGIAPEIVDKLNNLVNAIQEIGEIRASMEADGYHPEAGTPAEFAAFIDYEYRRWGPIIRNAGIA